MRAARWKMGSQATLLAVCLALFTVRAPVQAQQVDWAKFNAAFKGATFVRNDKACADCHEQTVHKFSESAHAQFFQEGNTALRGECESCHGPRSRHIEGGGDELAWAKLTKSQQSSVCLQCHAGGERMAFKSGKHLAADLSCTSCHDPKQPVAAAGMLVRKRASDTCYGCHNGVRAEMSKASHHPVREGRMDCVSCHNVHGSNQALLKTATTTETCTSCHAEKRGPFLWEHAPSRESCTNCHNAHGSSNRTLLNKKDAFLCLQCHSYGGHVNLPRYNRTSNPSGQGCVNCHMAVHGSNHPSGAKLTR